MHDDACANRITAEAVDLKLLAEVRVTKSLTHGTRAFGVRVHMLPERPRDVEDDGDFHFAILPPAAVSNAGRPSRTARRFIDETTGPDRPRVRRNAVVLVAPSTDGLEVVRTRVREYLGWEDVQNQLRGQPQDPVREDMLATWTDTARRRIPDAVRQAWTIVVAVNPENEIQAFRVTVASDPLFAAIKADRRARIQETAINAEALLPGGPYDLWRGDEASRRVKDLAIAFAENPRLPKMLRSQEILATIDRGVQDGFFVASLLRPDRSVKTWWRTPIPEAVRTEPALELFLPDGATLADLDPGALAPGVLPELWTGDSITVAVAVDYFSGGRTAKVQREGYEESVDIPACSPDAVEAAIADAVQQGSLWLLNGPASFQGEPLPAGVLTPAATLRAPMEPLPVHRLMPDALADAWKAKETTVLALSVALAGKEGRPIPWTVLRRAVGDAIASRWLETTPESGEWPCELVGAATVTLRVPAKFEPTSVSDQKATYSTSAALDPASLQDLVDALPDIVKAAAGVPLEFRLDVKLGESEKDVHAETVDSVNVLLKGVSPDLHLKR